MKKVINYTSQKEDWEKAKDEAFKKLNAKATIDGFRKGKAPRSVFERNYPGQIVMEATDSLINKEYARILQSGEVKPILEPTIDLVKATDEGIEVNFNFVLEPTVTLGKYKDLGIKKDTVKVTKEEVNNEIEKLLKEYTELVIKEDGKAVKGDVAVIDFEGFKDGVAFDGGKGENYSLELGSNTFIPGFEDGVIGMKKGESKDLELTFPEKYMDESLAGQKVIFKVTLNELKTKELPELNEEFFEDLGMEDIKSKEDLEKKMKEEKKAQKERENDRVYTDKLLEKAVSDMKIDLEDEMIVKEAEAMYNDYMNSLMAQGLSEDIYLKYANTTKDKVIDSMKKEAEERLKNTYLLNKIIEVEGIEATEEEADKRVEEIALEYNMTNEDVISSMGGKNNILFDIKVRKAIDLMK